MPGLVLQFLNELLRDEGIACARLLSLLSRQTNNGDRSTRIRGAVDPTIECPLQGTGELLARMRRMMGPGIARRRPA